MATLTDAMRNILLSTSPIRGIRLSNIKGMDIRVPERTLQSLLSRGWLETSPIVEASPLFASDPVYFLSARGHRYVDKHKAGHYTSPNFGRSTNYRDC